MGTLDLATYIRLIRETLAKDDLSPEERAVFEEHGRPILDMDEGRVPADAAVIVDHITALLEAAGGRTALIIATAGLSVADAGSRSDAEKLADAWGQRGPKDDDPPT